ncbi:hypothetical protein MRS44_018700 [Fusarium solani]|uniref:uncharacterized protein n=1 Tax=Fusarium solani TaxID=169388 RepID=UPI0032C42602|nr:hypothetical protein MRS44_018700 [Fusarium solani]
MPLSERPVNVPARPPAACTPKKSRSKVKAAKSKPYTPPKPIVRKEERHTKERMEDVILFLENHWIHDPDHWKSVNGYRKPLQWEAAKYFLVNEKTVSYWWRNRVSILGPRERRYSPHWPKLEDALFGQFLTARKEKKIVTTGWFKRTAKSIWNDQNPSTKGIFTFSNGWWSGFKRRHNIVRRRITKQSTRRPEEYREVTNSFLRYIRRVSQRNKRPSFLDPQPAKLNINYILDSPIRRFEKKFTLNVDETPIPFEYLDGHTYELRGARTVDGHSDRSGWGKRQATLVLYIFADGVTRLKPKIIFHGAAPPRGRIHEEEGYLYSPDVTVAFNETAYNNEELFLDWIQQELPTAIEEKKDFLLVMDVATFHKTKPVTTELKSKNVTRALIPPGCTSLVQPLDTAINRVIKDYLREETELYIENREKEGEKEWTPRDKRVMTTWVVARAVERLSQRPELVEKAFLNCGISIRADGSQDHLIRIKDISSDEIDFTGWEVAEDVVIKQEELVDQLFDEEELVLGTDGDFDLNGASTGLMYLKKVELITMAKAQGVSYSGNKKDIVDRLVRKVTRGRTAESCIWVADDSPVR